MSLIWQISAFNNLSLDELYEIMALRQIVFIIEQGGPYLDADGYDQNSQHLMGWSDDQRERRLLAYLRILPPGMQYDEASIGRVITVAEARGQGYGKELMRLGIHHCKTLHPNAGIRISAQLYLERFYSDFGFRTVSEPYIEDTILHIRMVRD